jgi:DNA polymerase-3 subunit chi
MTEVLFYHLQNQPLEAVLPGLLERSLARGWKAAVRAGSPDRVEALDQHLWTYRDDSFLPHGTAGRDEARQPVYLTAGEETPNAPDVLFLVDGADATALDGFTRCVDLFDGNDEAAVAAARERYARARTAGHAVTYWKQSAAGKWEKAG